MAKRIVLFAVLAVALSARAEAKSYRADRFDSRIEVARGGTLRVTETITIRFDDGPFTFFYRQIPKRMMDGLEIVSASMDGHVLPAGDGTGQVEISGGSRVRVTWHFAPVSNASHVFELTYLARGVVREEGDADLVAWRILPSEHAYRIGSVAAEIQLPAIPLASPVIDQRRVGDVTVVPAETRVRIDASDVRQNGWLEASIRLPRGSVIDAPPDWQRRAAEIDGRAGGWVAAAGVVLLCGLAVLFGIAQRYDSPPTEVAASATGPVPPDTLAPAIAGPLLTNGAPRLEHAMAAIFSMAERGELVIEERPRSFGHRNFVITRTATGRPLAPYEQRVLEMIFNGRQGPETTVGLSRARSRLMRHFRRFRDELRPAMKAAGLLDDERHAVRKRFAIAAIVAIVLAAIVPVPAAALADRYGGWPMTVSVALVVVALIALICYAAHTPLSNEGVRRAQRWRGFRKYLRDVARDREVMPADDQARRLLPFVVALGVASAWSSFLKRHRSATPPWFRAAADAGADSGAAFAVLLATGGAGSGGSGHGSGGGAAGGGASGAG